MAEVAAKTASDAALLDAVLAVAPSKNDPRQPDTFRLSGWCRREKDKIVAGLVVRKAQGDCRAGAWRVSDASSATFATLSSQQKTKPADVEGGTDLHRGENLANVADVAPEPDPATAQTGLFGGAL